ncbi:MAG: hypothetical protein AAFO87_07610, partial [Cyanobacteria bacterium J06607_6]
DEHHGDRHKGIEHRHPRHHGESNAITKAEAEVEQPLSFPYQAEIWSGRFAMLGLTTVAMAIALT